MLPFPINLSIPWLIAFLVASLGLVAICAIWIFTQWGDPVWKRYQAVELNEMREKLEKELPILEDPKWGEPAKAEIVRDSIEFLKKPDYQIKQILLKGHGAWAEGTSGKPVNRCMTCHIDEDKLAEQHPYTRQYFEFSVYGCTVCHKGEGRVLNSAEEAHHGMFSTKKEMMERVKEPKEILAFWTKLAELSMTPDLTAFDFRDYSAAGERLVYIGSISCKKCHKLLTPRHVEYWSKNKFKTWDKVIEARDYKEGDEAYQEKCEKCHTTGYDEKTGEYSEEGVTCEACHGPGEMFAKYMSEGKLAEAAVVTHDVFSYKVCGRCHTPRRHAMREAMLVAIDEREYKDWLASSFDLDLDLEAEEAPDGLNAAASDEGVVFNGSLAGLNELEGVGESLGVMLEDMRSLLPVQEKAVQTAEEEVEPVDNKRLRPLRAGLESQETLSLNAGELSNDNPEEFFTGTYADAR